MANSMVDLVESQVISAINKPELIDDAIRSQSNVAFLLTGDILSLPKYIQRLKDADMHVFVHLDFIEGISNDKSGIKYIARVLKPVGIITTKSHLIRFAKEEGMVTIQRLFLIDNSAIKKGISMVEKSKPDALEILPGIMPRVIYDLTEKVSLPLIAGGLIQTEEEILSSLRAGALAISVGSTNLWNLDL
ncbi:putative transcriptional antiterminator [Bacillus sp. TS-2]|nr:putative transcriptional antiterminator [Bacillus sp. TS-2]